MATDPIAYLRAYDNHPLADVPRSAPYRREISDDNGHTWTNPTTTTAEHAHGAAVDAITQDRHSHTADGVVTVEPKSGGYLIRYTPIT